jgi:hypothetical protein
MQVQRKIVFALHIKHFINVVTSTPHLFLEFVHTYIFSSKLQLIAQANFKFLKRKIIMSLVQFLPF